MKSSERKKEEKTDITWQVCQNFSLYISKFYYLLTTGDQLFLQTDGRFFDAGNIRNSITLKVTTR